MNKPSNINKPITIFSSLAVIASIIYFINATQMPSQGCFDFSDNTTQNWTLDQLYKTNSNPPQKITAGINSNSSNSSLQPFTLQSTKDNAIEAGASPYTIADKSVKMTDIYFKSPNLSNNKDWQQIDSIRFNMKREFGTSCSPPKSKYYAQLQLVIVDNADQSEHLIIQKDYKGHFNFDAIPANKQLNMKWNLVNQVEVNGKLLTTPEYTLKQLIIRLSLPGYIDNQACASQQGKWLISNVCPVK